MVADPQTRKLARQLVGMDQRLKHLETVPQLTTSSIDDGSLIVRDRDGNIVSRLGKQQDGTWGAPPLGGPTPPAPTGISAVGGAGIIHVRWTGTYATGQAPLDFDALEVLIDDQLSGAIPNRDGGTITIAADQGTRFVSARIRSLVPRHSSKTSPFSVEVLAPAEILIEDTTQRAEELAQKIADAQATLEATGERLGDAEELLDTVEARPYPSRAPVPPRSAPVGTQWLTPTDHLYVRIPCEEAPDDV